MTAFEISMAATVHGLTEGHQAIAVAMMDEENVLINARREKGRRNEIQASKTARS